MRSQLQPAPREKHMLKQEAVKTIMHGKELTTPQHDQDGRTEGFLHNRER